MKKPTPDSTIQAEPRIEYVSLRELQKWPGNPKQHDIDGIVTSIQKFGFRGAIVIDEKSGKIVAGHGRSEAVAKIRDTGAPPPKLVRVLENGDWAVPVLRGTSFESEAEAEKFLLADNRYVELGGWDDAALYEMLKRVDDFDGVGYDEADMKTIGLLLAQAEKEALKTEASVGPRPDDLKETFLANEIKQVVLYFKGAEYESVLSKLSKIRIRLGLDNNSDAVMKVLDAYIASNP